MIRRQTRLRREYLYRKAIEDKEKSIFDRKRRLQEAIKDGKPIPYDLKQDGAQLTKDMMFDEDMDEPTSHIDDEYSTAGMRDPKILITTSRDPSSRLLQFAKELRLVFPNSQRVNRGGYVMKDLADACRSNDVSDLVVVHEHRGKPDGLIVSHFPYGPTAYFTLHDVVLRHDVPDAGTVSEQYPHLIFDGFSSKLGKRVQNILKYLFPVPKDDSKRVLTFANKSDYVSFRHHVYHKVAADVRLAEVGPRFEMKLYEIRLGTIELSDADTEWKLMPYHRTARKRDLL
ncbi:Brix-domain-containing protein [Gonapodya prolifera JEL478]|uniref:U3 small nucleolar ribonucleoprotein protein IMP4 n=1 Tax=Gonapodya prolifera (strain JEL478) TaxID=1344416 RepID=A0A139A2G7_GONPJ|nr:Brix-domain-containing protein [Gonapodya prolifera JEL478]|eukprot:KXS10889.1 Brix-domain-containing protein [Gonapodya prolifera JEL478]